MNVSNNIVVVIRTVDFCSGQLTLPKVIMEGRGKASTIETPSHDLHTQQTQENITSARSVF